MKRTVLILTLAMAPQAFGQQPATIHVYRAKARIKARGLHPSIYCDGVELYRLHQGTLFTAEVPAGKHMITLGRSEVGQSVNMEPGKEYYFRFGHKNIFVTSVSNRQPLTLSVVSKDEALSEIRDLKEVKK